MTIPPSKTAASTYSLGAPPVKVFPKRENDLDWKTLVVTSPSTFSELHEKNNLAGSYGKTSPVSCLVAMGKILPPSSKQWLKAGMASATECLTLDFSVSPKTVAESSLSDILETGDVPQQYYLSGKHLVTTLRETILRRGVYLYVRSEMREMPMQEALSWLKILVKRGIAKARD